MDPTSRKSLLRPLDCTPKQMKRFGVTVLDPKTLAFVCDSCGRRWRPRNLSGWRLPNGYWKCPGGCNSPSDRATSDETRAPRRPTI